MADPAAANAAKQVLTAVQQGGSPRGILQIPSDATIFAARAAYKQLAKLLHPDKHGQNNKQADEAFMHVRCDACWSFHNQTNHVHSAPGLYEHDR